MSRESAMAVVATAPKDVAQAPALAKALESPGSTGTPETSPQPPPDELVSSRIAQIAKKEAKYQEEMNKFKQEREAFLKEKEAYSPLAEKFRKFSELKSKDPLEAMKLLEFSDTDFINFVAAQEDKSTPEEKAAKIVQEELAKFRKEQEEKETKTVQQRHEETITGFKKNIDITVKTNIDKFEFCNFYGEAAQDLIYETVNTAFNEDIKEDPNAVPMTALEAAELVEQYYEDQWKQMGSLKKAKPGEPKVEDPVAKKDEPLRAEVSPGRPSAKTLTNKMAATTPAAAPARTGETREQKRQRLMDALRAGVK